MYWDDDRIVEHYNAYTPFEVVIRDVDNGEHTLRINADNRFSKDSALHIPNDYMTMAELTDQLFWSRSLTAISGGCMFLQAIQRMVGRFN